MEVSASLDVCTAQTYSRETHRLNNNDHKRDAPVTDGVE